MMKFSDMEKVESLASQHAYLRGVYTALNDANRNSRHAILNVGYFDNGMSTIKLAVKSAEEARIVPIIAAMLDSGRDAVHAQLLKLEAELTALGVDVTA